MVSKRADEKAASGQGEPVQVRIHKPLLSKIDDWCAKQRPIPSRPEAIRRLLAEKFGLSSEA
jgi:hypothetical protein